LKRVWTPSRRIVSPLVFCLVGCCALAGEGFAARGQASLVQTSATHPVAKSASAKKILDDTSATRTPELSLANLRPGVDGIAKAERLFSKPISKADSGSSLLWRDSCTNETLSVITDSEGTIQQVTVAKSDDAQTIRFNKNCRTESNSPHWTTSRGLVIGDRADRVLALYGQPGSRGPSTKAGQTLELFYYAFDWAGPDVPQVMTVLCTPDNDGNMGRVVEITLAAPSL
jgi:hypothetical protein